MGKVFLASDDTGRQAAVKVVRSDLADVPAFRKRFARELDVAQRVHGPHIAEIYDAHPSGPRPWMATEYVPGPTLQEAIEQGDCFDAARLRAMASAIADALRTIHAEGVVHRDLKPSNILLGPDGPKVIDFGVARAIDASLLTNTGQTLGTPAYMSPEQADGRSVESPSDIFALGSLLVFAATGRLAFGDGAALAILHRVVNNEPDLAGVAEDDDELHSLIKQCLAKEPEDRPSAQRLIDVLGTPAWEPLAGVAWQQPPLGIGLPLTVNEAADAPTVAVTAKRNRGKRTAVISGSALAALALAAVAIVEGTGNDRPAAKGSTKIGDPLSGANSAGGSFPSGDDSSSNASSNAPTSGSTSPSSAAGSPAAPVNPGGAGSPSSGASTSIGVPQNPGGQNSNGSTSRGSTSAPANTSKSSAPASKTTSKPAPPSSPAAPPPAHNPPAPMGPNEIGVNIPAWFGEATVDVSWKAHSDATSYMFHYTVDNGTDQTVPVNGTAYSYMIPAGSTTCIQVQTVNQYGKSAWYPVPMFCFNSSGQVVSGSIT